jgi:hypothetical protein
MDAQTTPYIDIMQWRIPGDDEDELDVYVNADNSDTQAIIEAEHEDELADFDEGDGSYIYITSHITIHSGSTITDRAGREYRITIEAI